MIMLAGYTVKGNVKTKFTLKAIFIAYTSNPYGRRLAVINGSTRFDPYIR